MKKIIGGAIVCIVLLASVLGYNYVSSQNESKESTSSMSMESKEKTYEHTFPEQVTKSDFFQGTFMQNDVAGIYPRREALVKDILVDIGDVVKEGQTLAVLFEPGVEGQSQSAIGLKSTVVQAQSKILNDTKKIASAKISEFDAMIVEEKKKIAEKRQILDKTIENIDSKILDERKKIDEKKLILKKTVDNYDSRIRQAYNQFETQKELVKNKLLIEEKSLEKLKVSLENAMKLRDEKQKESKNNIDQKKKLLQEKIDEVYTQFIPLIYIGEEGNIDYDEIAKGRLSDFFSAGDSQNLQSLVSEVQRFQSGRETMDTVLQFETLGDIYTYLIIGLENTITSVGDTDESTISSYISQAKVYNTQLLNQKEIYDDALSAYEILEVNEQSKILNIEEEISQQESRITLELGNNEFIETDESVEVIYTEKKLTIEKLQSEIDILEVELKTLAGSNKLLQIEKLQSEIDVLEVGIATLVQSRNLLSANENKQITSASNSVAIAQADLNKEYVATKDFKIISPFSGVISKRDVEIGAIVSPKDEAFRITGVDNSLSRITKKEIKFFVPENLQDQIELDMQVYFSTANESKSFTGTVYRVSPEIDPDTRSITVQAKVAESIQLSNKSSIRVTLKSETLTYKIPTASIYNKGERKIVYYKKDNGKLGVQDITILSDDGEFSLVSGDFDATMKVVTTPIFIK